MIAHLKMAGRDVGPFKAVVDPALGVRTVLTNSPWGFVSLWLKQNDQEKALYLWEQARDFNAVAVALPLNSSPLLHYYSFMNAAKALLTAKNVKFDPHHGVKDARTRTPGARIGLSNESVKIETKGVLPELSSYLGETETLMQHSLQELFFNMPFIHRTYCLTYRSQRDMFIPVKDCRFVVDTATKEVYLSATLSKFFVGKKYLKQLPPSIVPDTAPGAGDNKVRSRDTVKVKRKNLTSSADQKAIVSFNETLRKDLVYIHGAETLWYVKGIVAGPQRLSRFPVTLALAAMHRLSELCRYHPFDLQKLLDGQKNWLLSEFIQQAPDQYIDSIASEITGYNFMVPNVRSAT